MNDEIKEILDWLKDEDIYIEDYGYQYKRISLKETKKLLDYITNLEQENERLKQEYVNIKNYIVLRNVDSAVQDKATLYNIELENINKKKYLDYKSRCEKTVEYYKYQLENLDFYEDTKARMLCAMGIALLQNGSDSQ